MTVKLLTENHLEFLSLKGGCTGSSESTQCQNVKLLEISCTGSNENCISMKILFVLANDEMPHFIRAFSVCHQSRSGQRCSYILLKI